MAFVGLEGPQVVLCLPHQACPRDQIHSVFGLTLAALVKPLGSTDLVLAFRKPPVQELGK
jgi:hypothetical protein